MKKGLQLAGLALAAGCVFSTAACGETLAIGKEFVSAPSQLEALSKLDKGEADVAVIDSVMAGYYTSTGDYADKMQVVDGLILAEESYGVAAKKDNEALISKINQGLSLMYFSGAYRILAEKYGIADSMALTASTTDPYANATDSSWSDVVADGTLVIGYTIFAPIAFTVTGTDVLTGFDIELARAVIAAINLANGTSVDVEFLLIDWNTKEAKLEDGTIDLVWNGMTITEEREAGMTISVPYLYNKQVAVVMNEDADKYTSKDSMKDAIMTAESGSAGESVIKG